MGDVTFLPCPFCGKEPDTVQSKSSPIWWRLYHRCEVIGYFEINWRQAKQELADTWNTRADVGIYTQDK
jgi:hypothetical protein